MLELNYRTNFKIKNFSPPLGQIQKPTNCYSLVPKKSYLKILKNCTMFVFKLASVRKLVTNKLRNSNYFVSFQISTLAQGQEWRADTSPAQKFSRSSSGNTRL